jgi:hypothetical protein
MQRLKVVVGATHERPNGRNRCKKENRFLGWLDYYRNDFVE